MSGVWTKGPWVRGQTNTYEAAIVSAETGATIVSAAWTGGSGCELEIPNHADESLILEAGTVANETGLAPRQLADQRAELLAAVKSARDALHQHYVDWEGEPEDAVQLQLARSNCDAAIARATAS
jgi:hypothetical protein